MGSSDSAAEQSGSGGGSGLFGFDEHGTDLRTELLAGLTTFLTMSYIIVVNPAILSIVITPEELGVAPGMEFQLLAVTTIISSVAAMLVMAFYANRPFGLAPGMGLNAFFVAVVLTIPSVTWQVALAAVFVEGLLFIALTLVGLREYVINLFPDPVKYGVGPGIGLFLALIGLQQMRIIAGDIGIVEAPTDAGNFVTLNPVLAQDAIAIVSIVGVLLTLVLYARGVKGSIVAGILGTSVISYVVAALGVTADIGSLPVEGEGIKLAAATSSLAPGVGDLSYSVADYDITPLVGAFVDGFANVEAVTFAMVMFTFFFVDFFDTAGTLVGLSNAADMTDENGEVPEIEKPLLADAVGTTVGGIVGTSTVTTYIESSTGIEEGGRTGMTALVVAGLFLLALVAIPLLSAIPSFAPYVAFVIVAVFMLRNVTDIDWQDSASAITGGLTIMLMPLTTSIATGIAGGLLAYPLVSAAQGEFEDVRLGHWALAGLVVVYYVVRTVYI
ncbi:NCS2 family permease [Haloarchaeobius salinus]|uniref:NCS2 family permease n=1 Tax=Haloarchaeobius salinus TaxID=1198298 RepID=UPI00210B2D39|nr:NCS2 family permease [Haloarchaeobius salinus]